MMCCLTLQDGVRAVTPPTGTRAVLAGMPCPTSCSPTFRCGAGTQGRAVTGRGRGHEGMEMVSRENGAGMQPKHPRCCLGPGLVSRPHTGAHAQGTLTPTPGVCICPWGSCHGCPRRHSGRSSSHVRSGSRQISLPLRPLPWLPVFPSILSVPWLVEASLSSLPQLSRGFSLCLCVHSSFSKDLQSLGLGPPFSSMTAS